MNKIAIAIAVTASLLAATAYAEDVPWDHFEVRVVGDAPATDRYVLSSPGVNGNPTFCEQAEGFAEFAAEQRDIGISQFDVMDNMRADAPDVDEWTFTRMERVVMDDVYVPGDRVSPAATGMYVRNKCEAGQ